ncbi:TlpA family protein disulfide reductase [Egicoccus sp. AB-alg2]|uniref:TlpA family protein disulfide reductase n=1 Tax=Egicoccus sp. AB-alg2 TaxID=3242693 RepID=UPI00359E6A95
MRTRVLLPVAAVVVIVAVAVFSILTFDDAGEPLEFGEPPPQGGATLPGDVGLDVGDVEVTGELPPRDGPLVSATWEQVAGWVARENAEGRPVVVNLWASWCAPCEREIPLLNETAAANPDIAFLGVASMDAYDDAEAAVDRFGIEFPALHDEEFDQVAYQVGARGLPTTVAFDTDGRMVGRVLSELNTRNLAELLGTVQ